MGNTLSFTQTAKAKTAILKPSGAGSSTQLGKFGDDANWKCVDDNLDACDEDTTYVYSQLTDTSETDLYTIETVPSGITDGTINYITVHAIGKSHLYPPSSSPATTYELTLKWQALVYEQWLIKNLGTTYTEFKHPWTTNPHTGNPWTWADIADVEIGIDSTVYPISGGASTTKNLYTSGKDVEECSHGNCTGDDNWERVHPDNPDCYAYNEVNKSFIGTSVKEDIHVMEDFPPAERGDAITKVIIWGKFRNSKYAGRYCDGDEWQCRLAIKPNVAKFYSDYIILLDGIPPGENPNNYRTQTFHYTWTQNPDTSLDWTWDNIDDLNIGYELIVEIDSNDFDDWAIAGSYTRTRCNELWAVIYYTTTVAPEIRTSAVWLSVNYTPPLTECLVTMPVRVSRSVSENIRMINFWDGSREVYFENTNLKTMVLEGYEYASGADDRIKCIRDMGRDGNIVTVDRFTNNYFNTTYKIASFGWKLVSKLPLHYKWIIELQELEE